VLLILAWFRPSLGSRTLLGFAFAGQPKGLSLRGLCWPAWL